MTIDFPRETEIETKNEMDAVLQAGRVLMESGAEIYRIEDTMGHMAKSLGIRDFSTYVVNRGVMISGLNRSGLKESRVLATSAPSIHLGKLEEVNRLSRELAEQPNQPVASIFQKLKTIEQKTFYRPLEDIIACVIGAGSFSLALGSSWIDGTAAAISGLFVGIGMQLFSRFIHTSFLQIILSSAIAALSANVLYYLGIGQHRSVIILGTLDDFDSWGLLCLCHTRIHPEQLLQWSGPDAVRGLHLPVYLCRCSCHDFHSSLCGTVIRHVLNTVNLMAGGLDSDLHGRTRDSSLLRALSSA